MGNVQRVLETVFCEAPGCPDDAAPDSRFCTRHAKRLTLERADCSRFRCERPRVAGRDLCEAHALIEDATSAPPPPPKEPDVEPVPELPECRIDGCEKKAAPWTVGARRQGGRYDLCADHLEELSEKARETRRRNREAKKAPANGAVPTRDLACTRIHPHEAHEWNSSEAGLVACPGVPTPEERAEASCYPWCVLLLEHAGACRDFAGRSFQERLEDHVTELVPVAGGLVPRDVEPEAGFLPREPGDVDLPVETDDEPVSSPLPLSPFDLDENLEPLPRMLRPPEGERDFGRAIAVPGIVEVDTGHGPRFVFGTPAGPQRDLSWAERALVLADVGRAIDDLEVELEQARARWRALASPE